jgi:hypothetical protein
MSNMRITSAKSTLQPSHIVEKSNSARKEGYFSNQLNLTKEQDGAWPIANNGFSCYYALHTFLKDVYDHPYHEGRKNSHDSKDSLLTQHY